MEKEEIKVELLTSEQERKAELTMLMVMETTPRAERKAYAKYLGISWKEYKRYVRKYRYVLRAFRKEAGTYKGEFEDEKPDDKLTQHQIAEGHKMLDDIIKHIHSKRMGI